MNDTSRTRSHWAWGWEDRLPDADARTALASMVIALLGESTAPDTREPVPLADACVPDSRLAAMPETVAAFTTRDREARARHALGRSWPDLFAGFRGDFGAAPDAVALPATDDELAAVLDWATRDGVAVIPWGGGTSVSGGVTRPAGDPRPWLALSLARMDGLLAIDRTDGVARLQAGATGPRVQQLLAPHGLQLRHYPQSWEFATVGGGVATRAGGHFATRYTHIDDLVAGVRMRTPTGVWETRRLPASGAGPDPRGLVLGSEGTLGVITDAWLRVHERPRFRSRATLRFRDLDAAVDAVREIAQSGLTPANCRLLDPREAAINSVDAEGRAVLILAFESPTVSLQDAAEEAVRLATARGGVLDAPIASTSGDSTAADAADGAASWRQAFIDGPYLQSNLLTAGVVADTFETCCNWSDYPGLRAAVRDAVRGTASSFGLRASLSCRFTHVYTDGPAPYWTWIVAPGHDRALEVWTAMKAAVSDVLMDHGATITHHHAVGRIHRDAWQRERPEAFARALAAARETLDPAGIMNPGVLLPSVP